MTEITVWQCDGCGERFGHTNTLREFPIVYEAAHLYDAPETETLVGCLDCIGEYELPERVLYHTRGVEAWGIGRARDLVTGAITEFEDLPPQFTQRADLSHEAEAVAEFVEESLL